MELTNKIKKLIEKNPLAFATISNGKPYVIGVLYCKIMGDKIIITDNFMKATIKNIKENNNVAIVVWDKDLNGYQFLGKAKYFNSGKWLKFVKNLKENKGMPAKGTVVIGVSKIIKSK